MDINKLPYPELKKYAKQELSISAAGTRDQILERIQAHFANQLSEPKDSIVSPTESLAVLPAFITEGLEPKNEVATVKGISLSKSRVDALLDQMRVILAGKATVEFVETKESSGFELKGGAGTRRAWYLQLNQEDKVILKYCREFIQRVADASKYEVGALVHQNG